MQNNELSYVLDSLYTLLQKNSDRAFPEFQFRRIGNGWEATSGEWKGDKAKGHVYHYDNTPFCLKNHKTGEALSLWEYVQSDTGLSNKETLEELARRADFQLPELDGPVNEALQKREQRTTVLEQLLDFFKSQLFSEQGKAVLSYLIDTRKYTTGEVREMELGFFPAREQVEAFLATLDQQEQLSSLGLSTYGFGDTYQLVIPYRDPYGRLKGFIVRTIQPDIKPKYKFSSGTEKDSFFLLHRSRAEGELTLAEGFLDALVALQRGIKGIVAIGGASVSRNQIENAVYFGIKRFTLALDNDEAGQEATERAVDLLQEKGIQTFVAQFDQDYKDPDELIREKGVESFADSVHKAEKAAIWKAHRLLANHEHTTPREREILIEKALDWHSGLPAEAARHKMDFLRIIANATGYSTDDLLQEYEFLVRKKETREHEAAYRDFFQQGQHLLGQQKFEDVQDHVHKGLLLPRLHADGKLLRPYTFEHLQQEIRTTAEGLGTGYESLDEFITIQPETVTLIAGRPSHGKTTVLLNLFLNMVRKYPDRNFFYFSYEETRKQLALKLVNILSGHTISEKQNLKQLEYYLRGDNRTTEAIHKATDIFDNLTRSERLFLLDESLPVVELVRTIADIRRNYSVGAIFIDYIQKIKPGAKFGTRQLELQDISARILDAARMFSVPVILGAQLGRDMMRKEKVRLDNLREAGDLEQDANTVLGIYNPSMERAQNEGDIINERSVDLTLTVLKNRNGAVNETIEMEFDRPILTIREKPKGNSLFNNRWSE